MTVHQLTLRLRKWFKLGYRAVLFTENEKVLGYCLFIKMKDFLYIRQFYVEKSSRRLGVGKKAITLLRKNAWLNERRLRLDVLVTNFNGIKFWKSVGFKDYCLTMELEK
jgi:ribosomal protein S18 acetylase RimI-like enzyme